MSRSDPTQYSGRFFEVIYPRFLVDPDDLIRKALLYVEGNYPEEERSSKRFQVLVRRGGGEVGLDCSSANDSDVPQPGDRFVLWQPGRRDESNEGLSVEDLPVSPDQEEMVAEIHRWFNSEEWYVKRGVPWRRGYLLYGIPGTGKTTFVKTLAQNLSIPLNLFDLSTMSNHTFVSEWKKCKRLGSPYIVLLEDLDAVFNGRENITGACSSKEACYPREGCSLTWDCLLSTLDGVESESGVLLFVTTNCPEKLDSSLGRVSGGRVEIRPGRIDKAVEFGPLSRAGRFKVAEHILWAEDSASSLREVGELVSSMDGATVAEVQERCVRQALKDFWEGEGRLQRLEKNATS